MFQDNVAVITGAASGIGLALAEEAAREGMRVVLADIEEPALEAAAKRLADRGATVLSVPTDVRRAESVAALADRTLSAFGAVHLLVNNAGVVDRNPFWETTLADWEWILGVNLWGVIHGIRAFLPAMMARPEESWIVNTASALVMTPYAGYAPYKASKQAVIALSETLERDLRQAGSPVKVAVLLPGPVKTRIVDSHRNRADWTPDAAELAAIETRRGAMADSLEPADAARLVFDGIRANRFYLATHPERFRAMTAERMQDLIDDRRPT